MKTRTLLRTAAAGLLLAAVGPHTAYAQNEIDILRYSYQEALGSTRTMAMGGAFGALGADLASLNGNPAAVSYTHLTLPTTPYV